MVFFTSIHSNSNIEVVSQTYQVLWSYEPIQFQIKGEGGAPRVAIAYDEDRDKNFDGLVYGTCVVGLSYRKKFFLSNSGNTEAEFDLESPHPSISFEVSRDVNKGLVHIRPADTITVEVLYSPKEKEKLDCDLEIIIPFAKSLSIAIRGESGRCEWTVDSTAFEFLNMHVESVQKQSISVTNSGDLVFPLVTSLNPASICDIAILDINGREYGGIAKMELKSGESANITVNVVPTGAEQFDGVLSLQTDHGAGPKTLEIPMKFRIFDQQVALDDPDDLSVGRILVGEEAVTKRVLTNYSSNDLFYRATIISGLKDQMSLPAKSEEESPWKMRSKSAGMLGRDSHVPLEFVFESNEKLGKDWIEAYLLVQQSPDNVNFSEVCRVQLKGGCGVPKLSVSPLSLVFGDSSISTRRPVQPKKVSFRISSVGNARASYTIEQNWDTAFSLTSDASLLSGQLNAEEFVDMDFVFVPTESKGYHAALSISSQLNNFSVELTGIGAEYCLHKESLPSEISLEFVPFGELGSYQVYFI